MNIFFLSNNEFHFCVKDHDGEFRSQRKVINNKKVKKKVKKVNNKKVKK